MKTFMILTFLTASWLVCFSLQKSILNEIASTSLCIKNGTCAINKINEYVKNESPLCPICEDAIPILKELIKLNDTKSFRAIATAVCVALNLTQESVCYQAVGLFEVMMFTSYNMEYGFFC